MTRVRVGILLLFAVCVSGCVDDTVERHVALEAASAPLVLPGGSATVAGDSVAIQFDAVEHLEDARFVVWAQSSAGLEAIGESEEPGAIEIPIADLPVAVSAIEEIIITDEPIDAALPSEPSGAEQLRGAFPGTLRFAAVEPADFAEAGGEVILEDRVLTATLFGLPELPSGFVYSVWLVFTEHEEAGHHGDEAAAGEEHEEGLGPIDMGTPSEDGHMEQQGSEILGAADEVVVTIEAVSGEEHMSPTRILVGSALPDLEALGEASEGGHEH